MSYVQNFQNRVLNSDADEEDKALLLVLTHKDRLENIEKNSAGISKKGLRNLPNPDFW